ncbi:MAG: SurA N-terminal domain-containing protein [Candidatus Omnitrophica bacterium]|nr:SurA N-terminal domain-containing protein [Candidatus Omnitrophota bacterium]MDD5080937.1 SurA N-terminal domain-containing protein [Candidatus Omnitrophota bacterium]MDD5440580.1 SurA N-terminal domain-containing protein [Candidatus Omnitrophota bacterium]
MLEKIRNTHLKKILWAITIFIIITFAFFGAPSLFVSDSPVGKIQNKKIKLSEFRHYTDLAQIHYVLNAPSDDELKVSAQDITSKAWELYLILFQADKEKYTAFDEEVVGYVRQMFSRNGKFSEQLYHGFLQRVLPRYGLNISPRDFEEAIRKFIIVQRYIDNNVKTTITDDEIMAEYKKDNSKIKINYSIIPYDKFLTDINVTDDEINNIYETEKNTFIKAPTVKFKYIAIEKDSPLLDKLKTFSPKDIKEISGISEDFLEIKETDFLTDHDPIIGIGWQPEVIKKVFTLKNGEVFGPINLDKQVIYVEKVTDKASYMPQKKDVTDEIIARIKIRKALAMAKKEAEDFLKELNEQDGQDLYKLAKDKGIEVKQTDYFKYFDYIEGIGLDAAVSDKLFKLQKGQIYKEPFMLRDGAYMIQLADMTEVDTKEYNEVKENYSSFVANKKFFLEKLKLIYRLEQKYKLEIYALDDK